MEGDPRNPRVSLLKKYDIPVDHLSYEFVGNCSNKKDLERIVRILRSGEEGSYPDLLKAAEERLRLFAPESRVLRVETPVLTKECLTEKEWCAVKKELLFWEEEMRIMDTNLDFEKSHVETDQYKDMPCVREIQPKLKKEKVKTVTENKPTRISSGNYAAWDKFDVDKELLKIDIEEERKQEENEKKKREAEKLQKKKKIEILDIHKENYSLMEQQVLAGQAKDRGNECYKYGDLEIALKYYDISIRLHPTATAYNNRAMTYLKLKQYESAIEDCNKVLQLERKNIKALHRRATAYQNLSIGNDSNNYDHLALQDLYEIVYVEPNNKVAQADLQKLKKKLNIEDVGKKFRMHISEEVEKKENYKEVEGKEFTVTGTSTEKLPLTYYGPSTSSFQCEPHSMLHLALSGSSIPGQVLCKCNSNRPKQNPLCQKCGEAMCTPKPMKVMEAAGDANPVQKRENLTKKQIPKGQANELILDTSPIDFSNEKRDEINKDNFMKLNAELGEIIDKYSLQEQMDSSISKYKTVSDDCNNHHLGFIDARNVNSSNIELSKKQGDSIEETSVCDKTVFNSDKANNKEVINKEITEDEVVKANQRKLSSNEILHEVESVSFKDNGAIITGNSFNQRDGIQNSKKSKHKKIKSKEHKENSVKRKHLESLKMEPVKVVHAAKYLYPTSIEPKVRGESSAESQRQTNISNKVHYKAFVPNGKCYSGDYSKIRSIEVTQSLTSRRMSKEVDNSYSSFEGNKENVSECLCNSNNENVRKDDGAEEPKREVVDSAYEFIKTWEELKKFDESYTKRAEVIRKIRPSDLSKVIGIKLDSDLLSCLVECLLRHFIENDPKRVMELLNQLPKIPRFGLVCMFLGETDKKKMMKLMETAEGKGFKLDEDVKKNLAISS